MSKRQIAKRIYVAFEFTGPYRTGAYEIRTGGFAGLDSAIRVERASAGHAIVRALRAEAAKRPDLFPTE
jgi:hypothetical protein